MSPKASKLLSALASAGILGTSLAYSPVSQAFDFGNMMNPSKWMGGGRDRYDDDYYDDGPYGGSYGGPYGGPYGRPYGGYGPGPYGGGPYAPPGPYGAPGYRAAPPPHAPAAPAAGPAATTPSKPAESSSEVDALKRRIQELEAQQQPPAPPPASDWGSTPSPSSDDWSSAPAFRPMGKN